MKGGKGSVANTPVVTQPSLNFKGLRSKKSGWSHVFLGFEALISSGSLSTSKNKQKNNTSPLLTFAYTLPQHIHIHTRTLARPGTKIGLCGAPKKNPAGDDDVDAGSISG